MLLVIVAFFTLVEAVFTALEVAMSSVSRSRLRSLAETERLNNEQNEQGQESESALAKVSSRALRVLELLERPRRLTFLFVGVTSLSLWIASCALMFHARQNGWNIPEIALALVVILFVAEVLPLLWASRRAEAVSLRGVILMNGALQVLEPTLDFLQGAGRFGARALGGARADGSSSNGVTTNELRSALATAEEEGVIESDERALLEGAMDFREREVREVMTPRRDVVAVAPDACLREVLKIALQKGHSRLPVFENENANGEHLNGEHLNGERAVGIVAAKDILPFLRDDNSRGKVRDIMRAPLFVQAAEPVAQVLESLRRERSLMAVVLDENAICGIVTLEDLLEEIVGAIQDEYDIDEAAPLRIVEENDATNNPTSTTRSSVVEADGDVKVRELERFWRETFDEVARLQTSAGEAPPSSQTLLEFAQSFTATKKEHVAGTVWRALENESGATSSTRETTANVANTRETNARETKATETSDSTTKNAARPLLMRVCGNENTPVFRFYVAHNVAQNEASLETKTSPMATRGEVS